MLPVWAAEGGRGNAQLPGTEHHFVLLIVLLLIVRKNVRHGGPFNIEQQPANQKLDPPPPSLFPCASAETAHIHSKYPPPQESVQIYSSNQDDGRSV